jgi:hypothetical protein
MYTITVCLASGSPGPKDEEAETRRLSPGQGGAKADSCIDQKAVKEMATGETDAGQWATHLRSN